MSKTVDLDDLAAALLMSIVAQSPNSELAGAILPNGSYQMADVKSSGKNKFEALLPGNSIAYGHNHPAGTAMFSAQDVDQANKLQRTSYIGAGTDPATAELRRYDPGFTKTFKSKDGKIRSDGDPVLAQFPIEEYMKVVMKRMGRKPDDPRGAYLNTFEKLAREMETDN